MLQVRFNYYNNYKKIFAAMRNRFDWLNKIPYLGKQIFSWWIKNSVSTELFYYIKQKIYSVNQKICLPIPKQRILLSQLKWVSQYTAVNFFSMLSFSLFSSAAPAEKFILILRDPERPKNRRSPAKSVETLL